MPLRFLGRQRGNCFIRPLDFSIPWLARRVSRRITAVRLLAIRTLIGEHVRRIAQLCLQSLIDWSLFFLFDRRARSFRHRWNHLLHGRTIRTRADDKTKQIQKEKLILFHARHPSITK